MPDSAGISPRISVIIPTFNRRELVRRTVSNLLGQSLPAAEYEIVVVVDGATDGTAEALRSLATEARLRVVEQPNRGQAAAKNAGLRVAGGDLVLLLDDDIVCPPDLVAGHLAVHARLAKPAVVFGPVLVSGESPRSAACAWMRAWAAAHFSALGAGWQALNTPFTVVPNTSLPRELLLQAGGFDEAFSTMAEDLELGMRLQQAGTPIWFEPSLAVEHIFQKSTRARDAALQGAAEVGLARKHPWFRRYAELAALAGAKRWKRAGLGAALRAPGVAAGLLDGMSRAAHPLGGDAARRLHHAAHTLRRTAAAAKASGGLAAMRAEFWRELPVLLYHHVGPPRPGTYPELTIAPEQFEAQLRWLRSRGHECITPEEWLAWVERAAPLPRNPVLLTFDDAYADLAEFAFPLLEKYGCRATVFVVTAQIGGSNAWDEAQGSGTHRVLRADQIREWSRRGITFGSHGRNHVDLRQAGADVVGDEIDGSASDLGSVLGQPPGMFAYPYGGFTEAAVQAVRRRYRLAFCSMPGLNRLGTDPHLLRRTEVLPRDTMLDLRFRVRWGWSPIERARYRLRKS